ncbi:unnamed protein product (macronuclear) [Paramecium tetraurelia]|uniref:Flagellar FliJ protein n=1 Tax=Paramecium tetraurelia TaxID=5888 RepID=A0D4N7_PARTE|nr:uncharacterized protein GSPATT00013451001 [Paramecium tetraurelia]CAK78004.1 unnamed protein product [Paramecium tetraurelia]|eukprot:XP_001445401.1 hypothetical protein (macronuclear) [Paramecium tetraurelia strain d4-2]
MYNSRSLCNRYLQNNKLNKYLLIMDVFKIYLINDQLQKLEQKMKDFKNQNQPNKEFNRSKMILMKFKNKYSLNLMDSGIKQLYILYPNYQVEEDRLVKEQTCETTKKEILHLEKKIENVIQNVTQTKKEQILLEQFTKDYKMIYQNLRSNQNRRQ